MFGFKNSRSSETTTVIDLPAESGQKATEKNTNSNYMYIPENCLIKGTIESQGDVRIDGKIEGEIIVAGILDLTKSAVVTGNIEADSLVINGELHGNTKIKNVLEFGPTGKLYGDIITKYLKIVKGAHFVGNSTHHDDCSVSAPKPATSHSSLLRSIMAKNEQAI